MASPNDELPVGRIAGAFGVHGELKCDPTSAGRMLFQPGAAFRAQLVHAGPETIAIAAVREHKNRLLIRISNVESAEQAGRFAGATLYAQRDRIVLAPGEYLDRDLVGCVLLDVHGRSLGAVEAVEHYPASDMLIVGGRMVPMVSAFITSIDLAAGQIVVDVPLGLLDDSQAEET